MAANLLPLFDKQSWLMRRGSQKLLLHVLSTGADLQLKSDRLHYSQAEHKIILQKILREAGIGPLTQSKEQPLGIDQLKERGYTPLANMDPYFQDEVALFVELPVLKHPIIFYQKCYELENTDLEYKNEYPFGEYVYDPETYCDNPADKMHWSIMRSEKSTFDATQLLPNTEERKTLNMILAYPPSRELNNYEKNIIWQYRYFLQKRKKALTKFLRSSVRWSLQKGKHAVSMLEGWEPIDTVDALELLSRDFSNLAWPEISTAIREYAVGVINKSTDDQLTYCLLQLVQSVRYDRRPSVSPVVPMLLNRASENFLLANNLFLTVEKTSPLNSSDDMEFFSQVFDMFWTRLGETTDGMMFQAYLDKQQSLVNNLTSIANEISSTSDFDKKERIASAKMEKITNKYAGVPIPVNPKLIIRSIKPKVKVFTSAQAPMKVDFVTQDNKVFSIIFKLGDDLRQDQLIIQLISLMDDLLKEENLDLSLLPYAVLATSTSSGMLEFVPHSHNISGVQKEYKKDLKKFLRKHNSDPEGPYGINATVHDTYVRSLAGFSVITYVLGVCDRHLDNLMLTDAGNFFHIDYGHDPKGFTSPMRLTSDMIEGLGGFNSKQYEAFVQYGCLAYSKLRKSAHLIFNLLLLMSDANLKHLTRRGLQEVEDRLGLSLTEAEAIEHIKSIIVVSVEAFGPKVIETLHQLRQRLYHIKVP